jgi:hypothetical protein
MKIIIEVAHLGELEAIKEWLLQRPVTIETTFSEPIPNRMNATSLFQFLSAFSIQLPKNYQFNREEANER